MKLDKNQLGKIKSTIEFIDNYCDEMVSCREDFLDKERAKEILEEEIETIELDFPGDQECISTETKDFLNFSDELKTIKIISNNHVKTDYRSYYVVGLNDTDEDYVMKTYHEIKSTKYDEITINLLDESIIIGMAATKLEEFDNDYWGTGQQYLVVEIIYPLKQIHLKEEEEKKLLSSYFFEIADTTGFALNLVNIKNPIDDYYEYEGEDENFEQKLREIEPYNEGMNLFVSAIQIKDPELKFLNFYKVLEHFSPVAVNIEANELMRKKLDAPKKSFEDGDFIRSIFDLANSMRDRFNDEDLIKASFNTCFDLVTLFQHLPETIKKKIKKHVGKAELDYSIDKQKLTTSNNIAAKIIYKTRNQVVHAKSNFIPTGEEIPMSEFEQLNKFMKEASSQTIRWYSRQPDHHKLEIIK